MDLLRAHGCPSNLRNDFWVSGSSFASQTHKRERFIYTTGPTITPVTHSNKAVAIGAASYYVDRFVAGRISKFTYGVSCNTPYQPSNPEHVKREHKSYINAAGERCVRESFRTMLQRVRRQPPFVNPPRQSHPIAGYYGSGGPGAAVQPPLRN